MAMCITGLMSPPGTKRLVRRSPDVICQGFQVLHDGREVKRVARTGEATQAHALKAVMGLQVRKAYDPCRALAGSGATTLTPLALGLLAESDGRGPFTVVRSPAVLECVLDVDWMVLAFADLAVLAVLAVLAPFVP